MLLGLLRPRLSVACSPGPRSILCARSLTSISGHGSIERRISLWDQHYSQRNQPEPVPLKITLKDGHLVDFKEAAVVTPLTLGKLAGDHDPAARKAVVAKVNGQLWDLSKPILQDSTLEYLTVEQPEGRDVFWHSSAHVLGQALEEIYGPQLLLCDGPPIQQGGFFYEFALPDVTVSEASLSQISQVMQELVKRKDSFQQMRVSRSLALEFFPENKYKRYFIEKATQNNEPVTLYRCGKLIDFCRGPHVLNTGVIKAIEAVKVSGAYWLGDHKNDQLQRVYGISFEGVTELKKWHADQGEARRRDHRTIGKTQKLFMMHPLSPGSVFLLPHGTVICNRLMDFLRGEYKKLGYHEVQTPLIYKKDLWVQSGHWEHYKDDMFLVSSGKDSQHRHAHDCGHNHENPAAENDLMCLKPMNCPGHCLIFASSGRSYKDLPLRLADFSPLHRNEISGALSGLTRVRKFQQDDAHIFCTPSQIEAEVDSCLKFIEKVYSVFKFSYSLTLSTRPDKYIGHLEDWDRAEEGLQTALRNLGRSWEINKGDGAFYGPKIDIIVKDALGRNHQTATIQLDFQLPQRFQLTYTDSDGLEKTPVIIHRAILGSVERMFGILIEHTAGKWPFWLSPRQVCVLPVGKEFADYAQSITSQIKDAGFEVELVVAEETLSKRIRAAQLSGFNFIAVVGAKEKDLGTVAIRTRQEGEEPAAQKTLPVSEFLAHMHSLAKSFQ